jgi:predicted transglutaminase-like cysteine proteinase
MVRPAISAFCAAVLLVLFSSPAQAGSTTMSGPAVFGTAAIATGPTPYAARWARVQSPALGAGASVAAGARGLRGVVQLRFVNAAVNRMIVYREDSANWNADDYWASAAETFARGAGDCEDYAIAKMQVLHAAGIPSDDLFLVIGIDLPTRRGHAILLVRSGESDWVLDNLDRSVHAATDYHEFRPVVTLSRGGSWLHGFKPNSATFLAVGLTHSQTTTSLLGSRLASVMAAQGASRPL